MMHSWRKVAVLAFAVVAAMAIGATSAAALDVKYVYAHNASVGHLTGDSYTGAQNGVLSSAVADFVLTASLTVRCNESSFGSTVTDSGDADGEPNGSVSSATFAYNGGACLLRLNGMNVGTCTVTAGNLNWAFTVTAPIDTAQIEIFDPRITINCGGGNCVYDAASVVGVISWNPAGFSFNNGFTLTAGASCPAGATFQAVYSVSGLDDLSAATGIQIWSF